MKWRFVVIAVAALAIAAGVLRFRASVRGFEEQINNLETFKSYAACLHAYHERAGSYPDRLEGIRECFHHPNVKLGTDWWGNAVQYESNGNGFVLVSFGRHGRPEGLNPWRLRELNDQSREARSTCGHPEASQVMSDLGFHRACFK